jgi:enolase
MSKIKNIIAREIKDSRQKPTIEVELETGPGGYPGSFIASVPSGASTGQNEALELRDEDGKGVLTAIKNVNEIIAPKLKGKDVLNQQDIDKILIDLDGTENKSKLGANAILAVSLAVCRAGAGAKKISLYKHISEISGVKISEKMPLAMFNILNGGAHAKNGLAIQEFMIVPHKKTFVENLVVCNKVFNNLKNIISKNFGDNHLELGDEGGFAPPISKAEQALYLLKSSSEIEADIDFALDCAASEFYNPSTSSGGKYILEGNEMTRTQLVNFYKNLVENFPIISIEDPFSEEDWEGFKEIKEALPQVTIVGDDLTTTNIKRIKEAHNKSACNGVILKLNQIGTVSETIEASNLAKSFGWKTIVSHRSGETMDDFIADLAVGTGADFLKAGSPAKEERMVKYNRLLEIERELSQK